MRVGMGLRPLLILIAVALVALAPSLGCSSEAVTNAPGITAPGTKSLGTDDPTCKTNADCDSNEQCVEGVCQIQRCGTQPYRSAAPLGGRSYFAVDRELVVLDDSKRALEGYEPTSGSFAALSNAISFDNARIIDSAGGNFTGSRPEGLVAALEGRSALSISAKERFDIPLAFVPIAVAAGDIDGDGIDEAVALSAVGDVAICTVATKKCVTRVIDGLTAKDVAMADVDADGRDEVVVLGDRASGNSFVIVVNLDDATTGQPALDEIDTGHEAVRVAAGNIEREGPAAIVTLEEGGYADFVSDSLRIFGKKEGKLHELGTTSIAKDAIDVYVGDLDSDDKSEILVLEKTGVEVYDVESPTALKSAFKTTLTATSTPTRLAMADLDGDSPSATLVGDAETVPGPVVPTSLLVYPPYSRTRSEGTGMIGVGSRESKEVTEATTVTLKAGLTIGYEADLPGIVKAAVYGKVDAQVARTNAITQGISIGDRFTVDARPDLEGPENGVVVLACACYHAYTYLIEDPAGRLGGKGGDKRKMSMFVPVGGQTALWSLKRYNALAARDATLPTFRVPYKVGDPTSYPSRQETLAGKPIPEEDLVFTTPKSYRVSDVARVTWWYDVSERSTQTDATTIGITARGALKVGPIVAEAEVGVSQQQAYQVSIGRDASFFGSIPPIRNDVRTPEDEHDLYAYGFAPIVYRDRYKTKDGTEGGVFVVTYSVAK